MKTNTMKSTGSTPSSTQKPRRSHLEQFLPLYKKSGESNTELKTRPKTNGNHDLSSSNIEAESPKRQLPSSKKQKLAVDISEIIIDGTNLNNSGGNSTPVREPKVTSTPQATKKPANIDKKNTSTIEHSTIIEDDAVGLSTSKSQKRSKSVSFLLEEKEQAVMKKPKSDEFLDATADTAQKSKRNKKNKKSEKENKEDLQTNINEPVTKKRDKKKNKADKSDEVPIQPVPFQITDQGDTAVKDRKIKKHGKGKKEKVQGESKQILETHKKTKKQKHQDKNDETEGEPASKSPKTEFIDNLENLNLGDNAHTLTNLIDEMAVVNKKKQKKKRKTANREKKEQITQNATDQIQTTQNITNNKQKNENGKDQTETDDANELPAEKKKWARKRWNKRQVAERALNTTINVDNLPASLLKGNYKKVLIDHFSKYGLSRNVGEAIIQNEKDSHPVFSTKIHFNVAEAAVAALEMDGTSIAGYELRVSAPRPLVDTVVVLRVYGHPGKLQPKDVLAAFSELGTIRSIKPMLRKKKTMATVFVEFDGPEAVDRALQKSATLTINGKKVMASKFEIKNHEKKNKDGGKQAAKNEVAHKNDDDSASDYSDDE